MLYKFKYNKFDYNFDIEYIKCKNQYIKLLVYFEVAYIILLFLRTIEKVNSLTGNNFIIQRKFAEIIKTKFIIETNYW